MKRNLLFVAAAAFASLLLQACATPQPAAPPPASSDAVGLDRPETSIPFANQRASIHTFQADGRDGLWVEDASHKWYYGKFLAPCMGVDNAVGLGFDTGTSDRLDRYSYVLVPREPERCGLKSFKESLPPPEGNRRSLENEEVKKK